MNLAKLVIFQGLFKQAKYLASSPKRIERPIFISETGIISLENLPMNTGYITAEKEHMTWVDIHSLKLKLRKYSQPIPGAHTLLICERSYVPLDPLNKIKPKDKEKLASLKDIARNRHAIERANVNASNSSGKMPLAEFVTYASFVIIGLCVLISLI